MLTTATITKSLTAAMLKKDALRVSVLRLALAAVNNEKIAKGRELDEAEIIALLQKEVKKRHEAIALYNQGKRPELAQKEAAEIKIINEYLPAMMGEKELGELVKAMKKKGELGTDFGQAMRTVMAKVKGKAEGKLVAQIVKQEL
ncbi:MAG: GatB/YqeY domain-containing protein [Candidatus Beckwithbacteria bacterium]|nr:GatB/YqeY domain-containing protein [Candidatus Beckwithbacteria bacterium]